MDRRTEGVTGLERRFACTQCGACCNRAPELELGECAAYAGTFVLRLMMRIYSLPRSVADHVSELPREQALAEYFESKRLLGAFSAASWPAKVRRGDRVVEYVQYLSLSVLPLDLGLGTCSALSGPDCTIYEARPLSCRSVPLHYSRPAAAAARDLDAFTATPGFHCATGADAALVISDGEIVDAPMHVARSDALAQATRDTKLKAALVKAMKAGQHGLPSPREVEAQAAQGALTASMQGAWKAAEAAGLSEPGAARDLIAAQDSLIARELGRPGLAALVVADLSALHREYAAALAA